MKKIITTVIVLCTMATQLYCQNIVAYVIDGNTCVMDDRTKIRIKNIDTLEMDQPYGKEAKAFAMKMLLNKKIVLRNTELDRYGRTLAKVEVNGDDFATLLVLKGCAWNYTYFSNSAVLREAKTLAKKTKTGLWKDQNPIPP